MHPDDIYWCTADPGWVTGTSYGIIAPLTNGVTSIIDEAEFDTERWYSILEGERVSVWYTAPTAIRMLMKAGSEAAQRHNLSSLRFLASVGEPLSPEAVVWGKDVLGLPFHDNWWQTETGGIMIANFASQEIRPGSMGRPLPGITAAVVETESDGSVHVIDDSGAQGELALRTGWPSMFRGYWNDPERYSRCFRDRGVDAVFGVIYPPQTAIVGFGNIVERPWCIDGRIEPRHVMTATLSADHRVTDGHRGALFLAAIARLLQEPAQL